MMKTLRAGIILGDDNQQRFVIAFVFGKCRWWVGVPTTSVMWELGGENLAKLLYELL